MKNASACIGALLHGIALVLNEELSLPKVPVISIVDDDKSVRQATSALVRSLGYAVATFASAEDFLESDRLDDTACLITDVQMPGLSGVELQSRLIADGRLMPIIGVTAYPEERIRTQMLRAGAIGFLSKPFDDECLIDCLTTALKSRNSPTPPRIKSLPAFRDRLSALPHFAAPRSNTEGYAFGQREWSSRRAAKKMGVNLDGVAGHHIATIAEATSLGM